MLQLAFHRSKEKNKERASVYTWLFKRNFCLSGGCFEGKLLQALDFTCIDFHYIYSTTYEYIFISTLQNKNLCNKIIYQLRLVAHDDVRGNKRSITMGLTQFVLLSQSNIESIIVTNNIHTKADAFCFEYNLKMQIQNWILKEKLTKGRKLMKIKKITFLKHR